MTDAAVSESAAASLRAMSDCIGREMAAHHARLAAERGATGAEVGQAWAAWEAAHEPPPCNRDTGHGWCVIPTGHAGRCLPLPDNYPPAVTE